MIHLMSDINQCLRVLFIEDDEGDSFLIQTYFTEIQRFRTELTWEPDAKQLEKHLSSQQWDLILLDGYLGAYNAVDLIPVIKSFGGQGPVIVLTGADNPDLDQAALEAGADDYVLKDGLSSVLLERVIRYNLERFRQHQRIQFLNDELEQRVEARTAELTLLNLSSQENEHRAQLLKEIAMAVHNATSELSMFQHVLRILCYYTGWAVGHMLYDASRSDASFGFSHEKVCFSSHPIYETVCQTEFLAGFNLQHEMAQEGSIYQQAVFEVAYELIDATDNPHLQAAVALDLQSRLVFSLVIEGEVLCFLEFFSPHTLDDISGVQSMIEEVQQQLLAALKRKMSERAKVLSERRLSHALRIGRMCSFIWDLSENKIWFSPEVKTLFDAPMRLPKNREDMRDLVHPDDIQRVTEVWEKAVNTLSSYTVDHRILAENGEVNHLSIQGEIEYDLKTCKSRMIGCVQNINERKANEFHLDRLKDAAETANTAKSTFLANMSHEIRTPLNAILGFTQILLRDPELEAHHVDHVRMMSKSGEHLLGLINDILEMSKIEAGRIQLKEEPVDIHELLSDLVGLFKPQALKKGLQLSWDCPETVPQWVILDKGKLRQILLNVLSNALKFTESGRIELRVFWRLGQLRFEVEDTGFGILEAEMPLVFESFSQTQSGMQAQQGTGLGMPISRTYARMMGGDLTLSSQIHVGTIVLLTLSCALAEPQKTPEQESLHQIYERVIQVSAFPEGPPRILIADNDVANHQFLNAVLTPLGFHTCVVEDGEAAVKAFQSWYPHLILMDVDMPRLNGLEAAQQIRAQQTGQSLPIIFVTASAFSHEKEQLMAAGANDILLKPLHVNTLLYTLEQRLNLSYQFSQAPYHEPSHVGDSEAGLITEKDLNTLSFFECEALFSYIEEGDLDAFKDKLETCEPSDLLKTHLLHLSESYSFTELTELFEKRIKLKA